MQQAQDIDGVINVSLVHITNKTNNSNNQIQAIQIKCSGGNAMNLSRRLRKTMLQ